MAKKIKNDSPAKKFFRGEVSLIKSFWMVHIAGGLAVGFVSGFFLPFILAIIIALGYTIFSVVGTWRSADKYKGDVVFAYLAKGWIVLQILFSLISIVSA